MFLTLHSCLYAHSYLGFCNASVFSEISTRTLAFWKEITYTWKSTWIKYIKSYILRGVHLCILLMISKVQLTAKLSLTAFITCLTDVTVLLLCSASYYWKEKIFSLLSAHRQTPHSYQSHHLLDCCWSSLAGQSEVWRHSAPSWIPQPVAGMNRGPE